MLLISIICYRAVDLYLLQDLSFSSYRSLSIDLFSLPRQTLFNSVTKSPQLVLHTTDRTWYLDGLRLLLTLTQLFPTFKKSPPPLFTEDDNCPPFIPKGDVIVHIAKLEISLYPRLEQGCTPAECVYVFHINKNAIEAIPADARPKIDIMGTQLNQAAFADGAKND